MWTKEQADQVEGLLVQFNGASEVCAVMGCDVTELDGLCMQAFGMSFERSREKFAAVGRALLRKALMQQAIETGGRALDMLAREQLGISAPTTTKGREGAKADADNDDKPGALTILQGKRKDRRTRATG